MGSWDFGSSHFLVRCCSLLPLLLEDQVELDLSIFLPFLLENQEVDQFGLEREETSKLPPSLPTSTDCCTKFSDEFFFQIWNFALETLLEVYFSNVSLFTSLCFARESDMPINSGQREREKRESQTVGLFVLHNLLIFCQTITFAPGSLE
jgi:hypothetical protein